MQATQEKAPPVAGAEVWWERLGTGWVRGTCIGIAPDQPAGETDPFVSVRAPNGLVDVRLSALTY